MRRAAGVLLSILACAATAAGATAQVPAPATPAPAAPALPPAAAQNPSPMVEHTRAHERLQPRPLDGTERTFAGPAGKPVVVFVPASARHADRLELIIHFLGAAFVPEYAVSRLGGDRVLAVVNIAPGTSAYARPFAEPAAFDSLLEAIRRETTAALAARGRAGAGSAAAPAVRFRAITLSGFSAGHGAIRTILRDPRHFAAVDAVLLIDGLHTGYVPDGKVVAEGGTLDPANLEIFLEYARAAIRGEKRFLITHSEIFPGTFASTTETTDWLLDALGLKRTPTVRWGPRGMQQLSEARRGRLLVLGFAGNAGPDHIDQLQSLPELLDRLERMK